MKKLIITLWTNLKVWATSKSKAVAGAIGGASTAAVGVILADVLEHQAIDWSTVGVAFVVPLLGVFGIVYAAPKNKEPS